MHSRKTLAGGLALGAALLALVSTFSVQAQTSPPNLAALKEQMSVLEAVIDKTMEQTFARPFGLLQQTKGTYLPGFGVVFNLQVNLYPVRVPNPFAPQPLSQAEIEKARKIKQERIETIKQAVPRLLADHAGSLRELGDEESLAVVVHLFHFQAEGERLPTQLVLQLKKADLDEYAAGRLSFEGLGGRMKVLAL